MTNENVTFGPQYAGDDRLTARMRRHQSWWRHTRLGVGWGNDDRGNPYGNYLTQDDAVEGKNFLTPDIHRAALDRISAGAGVEPFRCTRNLLSSQPMAFNLFGPLQLDPNLAALLLDPLLPGGVSAATVAIEWAPPKALHLNDATSFDVAVRYRTRMGEAAIAGIETKLTEPFSQRRYGHEDHHTETYRAVGQRSSVWLDPMADSLSDKRWNQIWRNHLLVESVRQSEPGLKGSEIVVHHPLDTRCAESIAGYVAHLAAPDETFGALTLDTIVTTWTGLVTSDIDRQWLADFSDRYVNLELSEP